MLSVILIKARSKPYNLWFEWRQILVKWASIYTLRAYRL